LSRALRRMAAQREAMSRASAALTTLLVSVSVPLLRASRRSTITRCAFIACPLPDLVSIDRLNKAAQSRQDASVTILLNKPVGYVTTTRDPEGRSTAYDLLPAGTPRVQAAGRLDADSSGLLLFTNDTDFAALVTASGGRIEKEYRVTVRGTVRREDVARFEKGLLLEGRRTLPARCEILERDEASTVLSVVLREGRNRQIRKMFELLGHPVESLQRVRIGPIRLLDLEPGRTRELTHSERNAAIGSTRGARRAGS